MEAFIVKDRYMANMRKGLKPATIIDESIEDHFQRIKDNASSYEEAIELFNLLNEEIKYRVKQYGKCINATINYLDWQVQTYSSKLKRRLGNWFVE
jgi:hypothetical protein